MDKESYFFEVEKLDTGYGDKRVVSDVNIALPKGKILTLIGPNGAGKTTLIKSMINQLPPMTGVVRIDKQSIQEMNKQVLSKRQAVVLTDRIQSEYMSVREVVATGRYPYTGTLGILSAYDYEVVDEAIDLIHIDELRDEDFTKLSDGQRQRVMLARALAQQPEVIVLDEPTSFLDIKHKLEFLSVLKKLTTDKKLTVVMSLHEVELAIRVSDYIACFKEGKLDAYGTPKEIAKEGYILDLYHINVDEIAPEFRDMLKMY